jgi:predicted DNA binding CopG/RHH family protein
MSARRFTDPYDDMNDEQLDLHVAELLAQTRERTVPVNIRWPEGLLGRVKQLAATRRVPYQRLIRDLVSAALASAETQTRPPRGARTVRTATRRAASKSATASQPRKSPPGTGKSPPPRSKRGS